MDDTLKALSAVIIGWLLNELSHRFRSAGAKREAIGRALTDLLEVRYELRGLEFAISEIRKLAPIPAGELVIGMNWLDTLLAIDPSLNERYDTAVNQLAGYDPRLAFYLRRKDQAPQLIARMRQAASLSKPMPPPELVVEMEALLRSTSITALDGAIKDLAWQFGPWTWWRVRRMLTHSVELPNEFRTLVAKASSLGPGGA